MANHCPQPQAHPARCGCEQAQGIDWRNALKTANDHTRMLLADRDALAAENHRLKGMADNYYALLVDANVDNLRLRAALKLAKEWLEGWASAAPQLAVIDAALAGSGEGDHAEG